MATKNLVNMPIDIDIKNSSRNHRDGVRGCPSGTGLGHWRGDPRINEFRDLMRKKIEEDMMLTGQSNGVLDPVILIEREIFLKATSLAKYMNLSTLKDRVTRAINNLDQELNNVAIKSTTTHTSNLADQSGSKRDGRLERFDHLKSKAKLVISAKKRPCESQMVKPPKHKKTKDLRGHSWRQELPSSISPTGNNNVKATKDGTNSDMLNITGVSLVDFFTIQDIEQHLSSLGNQALQAPDDKNETKCGLCGKGQLQLFPDPKYCYFCNKKIKNGGVYYSISTKNDNNDNGDSDEDECCFCGPCRTGLSKKIQVKGITILKSSLKKRNHDKGIEEGWVQCDECKAWQHQICALYNAQRDNGDKYKCPYCCLDEIKVGKIIPHNTIPAAFSADGLRQTSLSRHLEQRLSRSLKRERKQRAKMLGKQFHEVSTAENLFIREVSAVRKILKVNKDLLDIINDANYPSEFPYKSKMILLFQRIDGVDVAIFGMHVQEYGSDCGGPNHRTAYISYLDSVKYFAPSLQTANGEPLRSFVYQEILIGYLEYLKQGGFSRCYIWACPPTKRDDYLFYCHPETQRIPKPQQLRRWYLSMIHKAQDEKIVVSSTNLYEHHFCPTKGVTPKITAAHLPYYKGDSWFSFADELIKSILRKDDGSKKVRKNHSLKRSMMAIHSSTNTKDVEFMDKLGELILPNKEDFIVIQLQFECSRCKKVMLSGKRWYCTRCKNFQLCKRCHEIERLFEEPNVHVVDDSETHPLLQEEVNSMPLCIKDANITIENHPSFENSNSLLDFCQKNGFQFDTLRRAKHSSMMILHHLNDRN